MECWNCQAETHGRPFCPSCGRIGARAPGATLFDVFGLRPSYDLDRDALEQKYRDLSMKLHPDKFARAEAKERRLSLEQTSALNEAFKTLKDPIRRAFYLLRLQGVNLEEESGANRAQMPVDFLEEVMSLREELDTAREQKDLARAQKMADQVRERQRQALAEAVEALRALEERPKDDGPKQQATHALGRVRYFGRFLEEVEAIEEELVS